MVGRNLFLACLIPLSLCAEDFYVATSGNDDNPGSLEKPWRTLQHAADHANAGSTVFVREGVYHEKIAVTTYGSYEKGYITFCPYENEHVTISGKNVPNNPASTSDDIFYLKDPRYIKIMGFEIRDINALEGSGIRIEGFGEHVEIINNEIHEIRGGGENGGAMGITVYGTDPHKPIKNILIKGNEIHHCDPAWSEALVINGHVINFEVTHNTVHDVNNIGIDFIGGEKWIGGSIARHGRCLNNTVFRARSVYEAGAAAGIYVDGAQHILVKDNEVYECNFGIEVGAENRHVLTEAITVSGNYIHDNDKAGIIFGGYKENVGRVTQCRFLHNTLNNNNLEDEGFGEIAIQYANGNQVKYNEIEPGISGIAISSYYGNHHNILDKNVYCPARSAQTLIFVWNGKKIEGLQEFKKQTGQEERGKLCTSAEEAN